MMNFHLIRRERQISFDNKIRYLPLHNSLYIRHTVLREIKKCNEFLFDIIANDATLQIYEFYS